MRALGTLDHGSAGTSTPVLIKYSQELLQPNGSISGSRVASSILPRCANLLEALPEGPQTSLNSIDSRSGISRDQIRKCILNIGKTLHRIHIGRGHRIALVLPNGPELALAILAVTTWSSCVPLNAYGAAVELESDLIQAGVDLVIALEKDLGSENDIRGLAGRIGVPFCGLVPDSQFAGLFTLVPPGVDEGESWQPTGFLKGLSFSSVASQYKTEYNNNKQDAPVSPRRSEQQTEEADRSAGNWLPPSGERLYQPNSHVDEVLVLFTSGTTGCKKLVPHLLADVLVATACISVSWKLQTDDTNCNLMPLFHVGGIIRQVFSPILSGGCVICCPSFDPAIFWHLLQQGAFTWYYAAPTMHQILLQTGRVEGYLPAPKLRMIANAAGGLLPSLARELREVFGAYVLPSYGMTECMPITSPPATYQLEKPGTSGVAVGPEVTILCPITFHQLSPGKEGAICVRGEPCFRGYGALCRFTDDRSLAQKLEEVEAQPQTFLPGGWFNTGDLGYMDADGYLYITGRAKEVINRGGEIISPMEVEEAVNAHPDVLTCVAFSTAHSVLQEVVGIVLVPVPDRPKVDLPALHAFLSSSRLLAAPKWPQCLVYMSALPKSHTNKLLRVGLGPRLSLPEINDSMYWIERTFTAECPPTGTPVSVAIPCQRVKVQASECQAVLRKALVEGPYQDIIVVPHPSKIGTLVAHVYQLDRLHVIRKAHELLDAFVVPSHVCTIRERDQPLFPPQPSDALGSILQEEASKGQGPTDPLVTELQELFQMLLDLDCLPSPETNFFHLGGSSMLASQLASKVRKMYHVSFGGAEVFHHSTCDEIGKLIKDRRDNQDQQQSLQLPQPGRVDDRDTSFSQGSATSMGVSSLRTKHLGGLNECPFDSTRMDQPISCGATIVQLVPLFVVYPIWQLSRFFLFFRCLLLMLNRVPGVHSLVTFVMTLVVYHFLWITFTPLLFVAIKWAVIGRYRQGRYPLWGGYYLRWWFTDVMRKLIGRGVWGSTDFTLNMYYRMLGADIREGARISLEADLAEFDLVTIGEDAAIEYATVRPFGVDNGCMILGPVGVGNFASVGARSVVAPFTSVPDHTHLGVVTSSYEVQAMAPGDDRKHASYNRFTHPEPSFLSQLLLVHPITFFLESVSHIPALLVLYWMISMPWHHGEPFQSMNDLLKWLCDPRRIPFYIGIRVARAVLAPLGHMLFAILIKRCVIGKFTPGPRDTTSQWQLVRHHLAAKIFSRENMQDFVDVVGRHYEIVSVVYRLLGAKIGKRVFWPGHHPLFTGEFDLLEIGDDVVFGSRAVMFCTTADSCEKIILCTGSNISDNTIVLPGSIMGKNAVLGSNSVCPARRYLPESSVWFGSRGGEPVLLEKGTENLVDGSIASNDVLPEKLQLSGDASTLRPYGKAVYYREANYFVWPLPLIILYTVVVKTLIAGVHTIPLLGSLHLTAAHYYGLPVRGRVYDRDDITFAHVFAMMLLCFFFTHFVRVSLWWTVEMASKWGFMGRREEGRYNYDTSDYGQRWELYQIMTKIRTSGRLNLLDFIAGTPFMATYFRWQGCKIGDGCCLYPAGADPFPPEPDLVEMGDRCVIDCSSVVCHLNTRGNFELVKIRLENNVTLRSRSRIQQGVVMESGSMLLEKSLVMTGEVIEADSIWQGAPASRILSYETSSIATDNGAFV
jgi:acyl-CoA synthetase (AMP-forming)/AMP-acid ligase II/acetyltransferase-like isoleucine patch superfamily enzyme